MRYQAKNSEFHLTPEELRRLIEHSPTQRDRLLISLFVYTGIRRAELQQLRRTDLDEVRCILEVRYGKGGKQRLVYLPASLARELAHHGAAHRSKFLFPGRGGGPMSLRNINNIVSKAATAAGLRNPNPRYKNVSPHLLRHSFARNWKRAGGSLESLQKILGHASLKTTLDIYGTEDQYETKRNYELMVPSLARP